METVNLRPTPQGMVNMLLMIIQYSENEQDKIDARSTLIHAMQHAYAYWYPKEYKEEE